MSVFGIDGSKFSLPATEEIRREFDPDSGLDNPGKGHYPQCLVSTAYDVFERIPVARCIAAYATSERDEAKLLLPHIPGGGVTLFDRGYPSYEFLLTLLAQYHGFFVLRCPAESTFPAVEKFVRGGKAEALLNIHPSQTYLHGLRAEQRRLARPVQVRAIRMVSPDGVLSVLLTSMIDVRKFPRRDIIDLYFERYRIEEYYRHEKVTIDIETFHSRSPNGIRQELFAAAIVSTIAGTLIGLTGESQPTSRVGPQFKNVVFALAREAVVLTPQDPQAALSIFKELIRQVARVKYYRRAGKRPPQPRICKKPPNKWCLVRGKTLAEIKGASK